MSHLLTPEEIEEFSGLYDEEIQKIVDEFEAGILNEEYETQEDVNQALEEAVGMSEWVTDRTHWAIHTLLFSSHACYAIFHLSPPKRQVDDAFPFDWFAQSALQADCAARLAEREAYKMLPSSKADEEAKLTHRLLVIKAEKSGITSAELASLANIDADRLNNGGLHEIVGLLLEDEDPEWVGDLIDEWASSHNS